MIFQPRFVLFIDWGRKIFRPTKGYIDDVEWYSDTDDLDLKILDGDDSLVIRNLVKEFSPYEDSTRINGFGSAKQIDVTFFDKEGDFNNRFLNVPLYSKEVKCKVYMTNGTELFFLFDGQLQDPLTYDIDTKELSTTIVSIDRNKPVCYTPSIEDVADSTDEVTKKLLTDLLVTTTWPEVFGEAQHYEAVQLIKPLILKTIGDVERHEVADWEDPYTLTIETDLVFSNEPVKIMILSKEDTFSAIIVTATFNTVDGVTTATFSSSDVDAAPFEEYEDEDLTGIQFRYKFYDETDEIEFRIVPPNSETEDTSVIQLTSWAEGRAMPWVQHMYLSIGDNLYLCSKQNGDYCTISPPLAEGTAISWTSKRRIYPPVIFDGSEVHILEWNEELDRLRNIYVVDSKENTEVLGLYFETSNGLKEIPTDCYEVGWMPGYVEPSEETLPKVIAVSYNGLVTSVPGSETPKSYLNYSKEDPYPDNAWWSKQPWADRSHGGCRYVKLNEFAISRLFPDLLFNFPLIASCRAEEDTLNKCFTYLCNRYGEFEFSELEEDPDNYKTVWEADKPTALAEPGQRCLFWETREYVQIPDDKDYSDNLNFVLQSEEQLFDILSEIAWQKIKGIREKAADEFTLELIELRKDEDGTVMDPVVIDNSPVLMTYTPLQDIRTRFKCFEQGKDYYEPPKSHIISKNTDLFGREDYEFSYYAFASNEDTINVLNWWLEKLSTPWLRVTFTTYLDFIDLNVFDFVKVNISKKWPELKGRIIEKVINPQEGLITLTVETKIRMDSLGKKPDENTWANGAIKLFMR